MRVAIALVSCMAHSEAVSAVKVVLQPQTAIALIDRFGSEAVMNGDGASLTCLAQRW